MAQINKPDEYFNTKLYTGNGSTQSFTGVGFQPDLIWVKSRSNTEPHIWTDVVRGANKNIRSNATSSEFTDANNITSFDSDGFSVGTGGAVNENTYTFASWNWLAGGTASSNTDGSITSNVSANTTSGFSIVTYTGTGSSATIGHGLNQEPELTIIKDRDASVNWIVYTKLIDGSLDYLFLNNTDAKGDSGFTGANSTVFNLDSASSYSNTSGRDYIMYNFHSVKSFSKIGTYTGNGNADGTFVYTGFKPAFVLVKNTQQGADDWYMFDNKRSSFNQVQANLYPNTTSVEASSTSYAFDFLSNGFKVRASTGAINNNNETMIYMAFAEQPLVGTNNIPATAR